MIKVANALNNMGNIRYRSQEHTIAVKFYLDSIKLKVILYGKNSFEVLRSQCNLGTAYYENGNFDLAESIFEKVMQKMEESREMGLDKAWIYDKLGNVSVARKSFEDALTYYRKALNIKTDILKDNGHEDILKSRYNIALILCHEKKYEKAIRILLKIRKRKSSNLDDHNPFMAKIALNIADAHLSMGRTEEAESYCLTAMKTLKLANIHEDHPYFQHSQSTFKRINNQNTQNYCLEMRQ